MSMLIADRFVNSPCLPVPSHRIAFVWPSGLNVPSLSLSSFPIQPSITRRRTGRLSTRPQYKEFGPDEMRGTRCSFAIRHIYVYIASTIDLVIADSIRQRSRTSRDSLLSCLSSVPIGPVRTVPAWYLIRLALSDWFPAPRAGASR